MKSVFRNALVATGHRIAAAGAFFARPLARFIVRASSLTDPAFVRRVLEHVHTHSGVSVTPDSAMRCAAVYASVRVVSEDVAKLPLILYRRLPDGGKERATDHWAYRLLHTKPNSWQTPFEFKRLMQSALELRGNAYAWKVRVRDEVRELIPINPDRVTATQNDDYSLRYEVDRKPYTARDILHLRDLGTDGITGLSRIALHRETIGLQLAAQEFGAKLLGNGARHGVVLSTDAQLTDKQAQDISEGWDRAYGGGNVGKTAVLFGGLKPANLTMTAKDAMWIDEQKLGRTEIASIFRVPPHKIGDLERATFSNIEQQSIDYIVDALQPRTQLWEERLLLDLLSNTDQQIYFFEFLFEALLRGDTLARYQAYHLAITDGWLNRNQVRVRENENPAPGLDVYLTPQQSVPVGQQTQGAA